MQVSSTHRKLYAENPARETRSSCWPISAPALEELLVPSSYNVDNIVRRQRRVIGML